MAVLKVQVDSFGNLNKKNMTKKIMFSDKYGLTNAVLEGRKTQTRRIITYPKTFHGKDVCGYYVCRRATDRAITEVCMYDENGSFIDEGQILPKYKVGEVIAVAQSYNSLGYDPNALDISPTNWRVVRGILGQSKGWNNKMFVRAEGCKHKIRITDVRVERLQDITDECCLKEGVIKKWHAPACKNYYYVPGVEVKSVKDVHDTPQEAFAHLINKVSKKDVWQENPYVFVYDFELVK